MRYGIGVARSGFNGGATRKSAARRNGQAGRRRRKCEAQARPAAHMEGGPGQSAGRPRALSGSSIYRIHGTNEPWTIGQNVSSGCIRMMNDDVIDLYDRVPVGAPVDVL